MRGLTKSLISVAAFGSIFAGSALASDVDRGANTVQFQNQTDDQCNIFINNVFRGVSAPGLSDKFPVGRTNLKPLNILLRCSDEGLYALQIESVKDECLLTFDEEGNGITAQCTGTEFEPEEEGEKGEPGEGGDADRGVYQVQIKSLLDDECGVWINGRLAAQIPELGSTGWLPANRNNLSRTNILLRCSDGGVYGTSIEAVYQQCAFELDEEGGGLRTVSCQ